MATTASKEESRQALREALAAARGDDPGGHDQLLARLRTPELLDRLDSEAEYQMASKFRLHVGQVLDALAKNPEPTARHVIIELTADDVFLANDERIIALIRASANVRPPLPPLVAFWDRHSQPDDGFTPTTIPALVDNGDPKALALLERKLADPSHEDDEKLSWMRTSILTHRNDLPLLEACQRMLAGTLPVRLRPALVAALFDYRPEEWYRPAKSYSAPPLESASREVLAQLERIGEEALLAVALDETERTVVRARLEAIAKLKSQLMNGDMNGETGG